MLVVPGLCFFLHSRGMFWILVLELNQSMLIFGMRTKTASISAPILGFSPGYKLFLYRCLYILFLAPGIKQHGK